MDWSEIISVQIVINCHLFKEGANGRSLSTAIMIINNITVKYIVFSYVRFLIKNVSFFSPLLLTVDPQFYG
jgi:hypothetical protein